MDEERIDKLLTIIIWFNQKNQMDNKAIKSALDQIIKKMMMGIVYTCAKMTRYGLMKFIKSFEGTQKNIVINVNNSHQASYLDLYFNSIRKKLLKKYAIIDFDKSLQIEASDEENQEEEESKSIISQALPVQNFDLKAVINNFWIICHVVSYDYPIISNSTIFEEFTDFFQNNISIDNLDVEEIDKLIEIKSLIRYSMSKNLFKQFFDGIEFADKASKRLNDIKSNAEQKLKGQRSEIMKYFYEVVSDKSKIKEEANVIIDNNLFADIVVSVGTTKRYAFFLGNESVVNNYQEECPEDLFALRNKVCSYLGYDAITINLLDWRDKSSSQKKEMLSKFISC